MSSLRLQRFLQQHRERYANLRDLCTAINEAYAGTKMVHGLSVPKENVVKEKLLRDILEDKLVSIKIRQLEALDAFLAKHGQGLGDEPLFESGGILRNLTEQESVHFFVPSRVDRERERGYLSIWDAHSFATVSSSINQLRRSTGIELKVETQAMQRGSPGDRDWRELLEAANTSYCAAAALRAFGLIEFMLAEMFEVRPFEAIRTGARPIPFSLVWYPPSKNYLKMHHSFTSRFAVAADDLQHSELELPDPELIAAIKKNEAQAFIFDNKVHPSWTREAEYDDYGVIVAQRRPSGAVWLVVSGLSGPGVHAAASQVRNIRRGLPQANGSAVSPPLYAIVRAKVSRAAESINADPRKVVSSEIIAGPMNWTPG